MSDYDNIYDDPQMFDHLQAIGRIAATWSAMEFVINEAIWDIANLDQHTGTCLTAQIIAPIGRMRALISLLELNGAKPDSITEFNKLSQKIDNLARRRNRAIHDPWGMDPESGWIGRIEMSADRRLIFTLKPVELNELAAITLDIEAINRQFDCLYKRVRSELPSLKQRPPVQSRVLFHRPRSSGQGS